MIKELGSALNRNFRNDGNDNFTDHENRINKNEADIIEHGVELEKHDKAINAMGNESNLGQRVTQLEQTSQDGEVLAARQGYASLADRLNALDPGVVVNSKTFTATAGQTLFSVASVGSYAPNQNRLTVFVGGVPQIAGKHFTETSSTSFTMTEGVPVGVEVYAKWFEGNVSILSGHGSGHKKGGFDELNVKDLAGFEEEVSDKIENLNKKAVVHVSDYDNLVTDIGTSTADWKPAIQAAVDAVKSTGGVIKFPKTPCKINTPIDMTDITTAIALEGEAPYISAIQGNTGGVMIDQSGSTSIVWRNLRLVSSTSYTNPSTIGLLIARTTTRSIAAFSNNENFEINMPNIPTANGGYGTIGIYNFAGELYSAYNVILKADIPVVFTNTNIYSIASPFKTLITGSSSMSVVDFSGACELSASKGSAVVLSGAGNVSFSQTYLTKQSYNTETAAISVVGITRGLTFEGNVEDFGTVLRNTATINRLALKTNSFPIAELPMIDCQNKILGFDINCYPSDEAIEHDVLKTSVSGVLRQGRIMVYAKQNLNITQGNSNSFGVSVQKEGFDTLVMKESGTGVNLTSGASIQVAYRTATYNVLSSTVYDTTTGVFTAPVTSLYEISASYEVNMPAVGNVDIYVKKNGATVLFDRKYASVAGKTIVKVNGIQPLVKGDTITVEVLQSSGSAVATTFTNGSTQLVIGLVK